MQEPVSLQEPFTYHILIIVILLIIIILLIGSLFYKKKKIDNKEIKLVGYPSLLTIKNKYLQKLDQLSYQINNHQYDNRRSFYELSKIIRSFVYETTNINVVNLSKKEIEEYHLPYLKELMEEYYIPEFSTIDCGDINESIKKTRGVINKWN